MADDKVKPAGKKPHPAIFVGVIVVILVILGFAQFTSRVNEDAQNAEEQTTEQQAADATGDTPGAETETAATSAAPPRIDVNAALSDRILGDPSAPVKISEHASFTCGHCGEFHRDTFGELKKQYIDTGKVYLVFSDFPLNAPAVQASMVARCLPEAKYFDFVSMLFEKQDDWAYDTNYLEFLKTEAGKAGLDEAHFNACIENKELQEGIVNRMKGVAAQWNIASTPSFVINNRTTLSGAYPIEEFKKILDTELSGQKSAAPSASGASESAASPSEEQETTEEPATQEEPEVEPAASDEATPAPETTPAPAAESEEDGTTKAE